MSILLKINDCLDKKIKLKNDGMFKFQLVCKTNLDVFSFVLRQSTQTHVVFSVQVSLNFLLKRDYIYLLTAMTSLDFCGHDISEFCDKKHISLITMLLSKLSVHGIQKNNQATNQDFILPNPTVLILLSVNSCYSKHLLLNRNKKNARIGYFRRVTVCLSLYFN